MLLTQLLHREFNMTRIFHMALFALVFLMAASFATAACPQRSEVRVRAERTDRSLPPRFFHIGQELVPQEYAENQAKFELRCYSILNSSIGEVRINCVAPGGAAMSVPLRFASVVGDQSQPFFLKNKQGIEVRITAGCFPVG